MALANFTNLAQECHALPSYTAAVIGLGRIAFSLGFDKLREQPASHTMALLDNPRVRIVSGCDIDKDKRGKWKEYAERKQHSHVAVYDDARKMFDALKKETGNIPDIVIAAANEDAHLDIALDAIKAHPSLLILEKPVALNSAQGERIKEAAKENCVPVMVNHERRFANDYRFAREYIAQGNIGEVQSVTAELSSSLRVYSPKEDGTGAYSLIHDGTHLVDITRFLLGDACLARPLLVSLTRDKNDVSIVRNICVHFEAMEECGAAGGVASGGVIPCPDVLIKISGRSKFFYFGVEVLGTHGRVRLGNGFAQFERREQSKLYTGFYSLAADKSARRIVRGVNKTRYFSNMIQSAINFLDGTAPLESTLQDGLDDLKTLEDMKSFCTAV